MKGSSGSVLTCTRNVDILTPAEVNNELIRMGLRRPPFEKVELKINCRGGRRNEGERHTPSLVRESDSCDCFLRSLVTAALNSILYLGKLQSSLFLLLLLLLYPFHCAASRQTLIPVSFPPTLPLLFHVPTLQPRSASHRPKFEICYTVLLLIEFEEENAVSAPQAFHH